MKQDFVEVDIPQTKMSMAVLKCMKMAISNWALLPVKYTV